MKRFSTLLIILGVLIAAYPLLDRAYTWYMQRQIEATYAELDQVFVNEPENVGAAAGIGTPAAEAQAPAEPEPAPETPAVEPAAPAPAPPAAPKVVPKPIGFLHIGKINLKLPILSGASAGNLKIGAGWMKQTTPIGQNGNTALAAHRSYTRGRFFNRLDEMAIGDSFTIVSDGKEYVYNVFNIVVVEPTDVSVLRGNKGESVVTLITCTPIKVATHRLIVQGKLVQ